MPVNFLDSNVVLYSLAKDDAKQLKALELLASGCVISTQVLNEEDLQHGQVLESGLTIINPFLSGKSSTAS